MKFKLTLNQMIFSTMLILLGSGVVSAQSNDAEPPGPLQGKVRSVIPMHRTAVIKGREVNLKRLFNDEESHERLLRDLAEPIDVEKRQAEHEKRLNRYGSQRISNLTMLTDYGSEVVDQRKLAPAVSAKEPEKDEESNTTIFVLVGVFAGSIFILVRARD